MHLHHHRYRHTTTVAPLPSYPHHSPTPFFSPMFCAFTVTFFFLKKGRRAPWTPHHRWRRPWQALYHKVRRLPWTSLHIFFIKKSNPKGVHHAWTPHHRWRNPWQAPHPPVELLPWTPLYTYNSIKHL